MSELNASGESLPLLKQLELLGYGTSFQDQICSMLEQTQLFSNSKRQDIEVIANYTHAYRAPADTQILDEGGKDRLLWFLIKGQLDILKSTDKGTQKKLATIRPGKSIGEMSLIDEQPHSASVVTTRESTLLLITRDSFFRLASQHPRQGMHLTWRLAQQLSHRLRQTSGILIEYL